MTKITIGDKKLEIPSRVCEVLGLHFKSLSKRPEEEAFLALSGLEDSALEGLTETQKKSLSELAKFVLPEELSGVSAYLLNNDFDEIDVSEESFEKMETARDLIAKASSPVYSIPELLELYRPEVYAGKIDGASVCQFLPEGLHILNQILEFITNFQTLADVEEPTAEEIEAGIKELDVFGTFGTVRTLAEGDVLKFDAILAAPASVVYTELAYRAKYSRYTERLYEIRQRARPKKN